MSYTEWRRVPPDRPNDDADERPMEMTQIERFANNMMTIVIARAAMIVTPVLLSFFAWLMWGVYQGIESRVVAVEAVTTSQARTIQDHESRLVNGKQAREQFQIDAKEQFGDINATLRSLNTEINTMNGNIIRLQTTIDNRLPPRSGSVMDPSR